MNRRFYHSGGLFAALLAAVVLLPARAAGEAKWSTTTDHFTLSAAEALTPDGSTETTVTVSLVGSRLYTAYNMDITLPAGVELAKRSNGNYYVTVSREIQPYEEEEDDEGNTTKTYSHSLKFSYGVIGERILRLICTSNSSENFTKTSGKLFTFRVKASPYCRTGEVSVSMMGLNLTTADATKYVPYDVTYTLKVKSESTVGVNVRAANRWGTLVLPFGAALPDGLQAYGCSDVSGDDLVLSDAAQIEAYTPYILYAPSGYSGTLSGTVDDAQYAETVSAGLLRGTVVPCQVSTGYILQNQGAGAKFYNTSGQNFAIPEGRCWLELPSTAPSKTALSPVTTPTGIHAVSTAPHAADVYYNLDGTRVLHPQSGHLYIKNGQKVLKR